MPNGNSVAWCLRNKKGLAIQEIFTRFIRVCLFPIPVNTTVTKLYDIEVDRKCVDVFDLFILCWKYCCDLFRVFGIQYYFWAA